MSVQLRSANVYLKIIFTMICILPQEALPFAQALLLSMSAHLLFSEKMEEIIACNETYKLRLTKGQSPGSGYREI